MNLICCSRDYREEINVIQKQNQDSFLLKVNLKLYVFSEDDNHYVEAELHQRFQ